MDNVLRRGATGSQVTILQQQLNKVGCIVAVDGQFGPGTSAAVIHFQKANGLEADGAVGPKTRQLLDEVITKARVHPDQADAIAASLAAKIDVQSPEAAKVIESLLEMLAGDGGGGTLDALLAQLGSNGLGSELAGWIASGPNYTPPPDKLKGAVGDDFWDTLMVKCGLGPVIAGGVMAVFLPALIDELTPNGSIDTPQAASILTSALKKKRGR